MQQRSNLYTFLFATLVCLFCSIGLAIGATALKPFQVTNYRLDIISNIVSASGFPEDRLAKMSPKEILELYRTKFDGRILDKHNQPVDRRVLEEALLPLNYKRSELEELYVFEVLETYNKKLPILARRMGKKVAEVDPGYKLLFSYKPEDRVTAYILPIEGYGLWDMMYGYMALAPDLNTIIGVRFYNHKETPGLGAEAEKPWFTSQYRDKKILDEQGQLVSILVAKAKARNDREVDGISGATMTGKGINKFMKEDLERYEPYFKTLRAEGGAETPDAELPGQDAGETKIEEAQAPAAAPGGAGVQ